MNFSINDKLYNNILEYCKLNHIEDIESEINKLIEIGFNVDKYGNKPFVKFQQENAVADETKNNIEETKSETIDESSIQSEEDKQPKNRKRTVRIIKN